MRLRISPKSLNLMEVHLEDEPAKAKIQFILHNNKSFELGHVGINGVSLNRFASLAVVGKVLDSYQPKK